MNVSMAIGMVDVLVNGYQEIEQTHKSTGNPPVEKAITMQSTILSILLKWYEGPLKKDKFVRKHVKEAIFKINKPFAEGYFK